MAADRLRPNPYHRYALPGAAAAYLASDDGGRYVGIAPTADGFAVDHGALAPAEPGGGTPARVPAAPPERFGPTELAAAVQRVCALAATWLDYDEWQVEQTRALFVVGRRA